MRSSIEQVRTALGCQKPPQSIWQRAFDYDYRHLHTLLEFVPSVPDRLSHARNALTPNFSDLVGYALDLQYEEIQPDLFRCLFPLCLQAWRQHVFTPLGSSPYAGFVEELLGALASRPIVQDLLEAQEQEVVVTFMQDTILDRLDQQEQLSYSKWKHSPASTWFPALGSFAILFPVLERLWRMWWAMETRGQANAVLQYLSCLIYQEQSNLIFPPWIAEQTGGPSQLWESDVVLLDQGNWRPENIAFFQSTMTPAYVEEKLREAVALVGESTIAETMARDLETKRHVLEYRLEVLPVILASSPAYAAAEALWL